MPNIPRQPNRGRGSSAEDKRWAEMMKRNPPRGGGGGGRIGGGGGGDWKGGGGCAVIILAGFGLMSAITGTGVYYLV